MCRQLQSGVSAQAGLGCKGNHKPLVTLEKAGSSHVSNCKLTLLFLLKHNHTLKVSRVLSGKCFPLGKHNELVKKVAFKLQVFCPSHAFHSAEGNTADENTEPLWLGAGQSYTRAPRGEKVLGKICWMIIKQYKATPTKFWFCLILSEKYAWNVENSQKWTWILEGCVTARN